MICAYVGASGCGGDPGRDRGEQHDQPATRSASIAVAVPAGPGDLVIDADAGINATQDPPRHYRQTPPAPSGAVACWHARISPEILGQNRPAQSEAVDAATTDTARPCDDRNQKAELVGLEGQRDDQARHRGKERVVPPSPPA